MSGDAGGDTRAPMSDMEAMGARVSELESEVETLRQQLIVLRRKEDVLHATLDSAEDGILAVGERGQVIFANREFVRMWHIPPDLMEAADDNELLNFVLDQLDQPEAFLAKVRELYKSFGVATDRLVFHDGRIFERTSHPLVVSDVLCGRVWTFRDLTPDGTQIRRTHE